MSTVIRDTTRRCRDYIGKLWKQAANVYKNCEIFITDIRLVRKVVYRMHGHLKNIVNVKDDPTEYPGLLAHWIVEVFIHFYDLCEIYILAPNISYHLHIFSDLFLIDSDLWINTG